MNERIDKEKYIFAALFDVVNKLQILGDRKLKDTGVTTRQWFLTLLIQQMEPKAPSIGDCARQMGTSHQNIRQITKRLEARGFLRIQTDSKDRRTQRLYLTQSCREFWNSRNREDITFISELFNEFTAEEIDNLFVSVEKLRNILNERKS
ncbi:MAG: MarR family transcriptional regulator [Spirochaetales bacterium]|nr:MarR family transcriptional regulator [Spirochaetales bacterium]